MIPQQLIPQQLTFPQQNPYESVTKCLNEDVYRKRMQNRDIFYKQNLKILQQTFDDIRELEAQLSNQTYQDTCRHMDLYTDQSFKNISQEVKTNSEKAQDLNEISTKKNSIKGRSESTLKSSSVSYMKRIPESCSILKKMVGNNWKVRQSVKTSIMDDECNVEIKKAMKAAHIKSGKSLKKIIAPEKTTSKNKNVRCSNCIVLLARGFSSANCPCHRK